MTETYPRIDETFFRGQHLWRAFKTAPVQARRLEEDTEIRTVMSDGHEETVKRAAAGEVLLTNPTGESYAVAPDVFARRYGPYAGPGEYRPVGRPIRFARTQSGAVLTAPWGEEMRIKPGGAIVWEGPGKIYGIQPAEFALTYEVLSAHERYFDVAFASGGLPMRHRVLASTHDGAVLAALCDAPADGEVQVRDERCAAIYSQADIAALMSESAL